MSKEASERDFFLRSFYIKVKKTTKLAVPSKNDKDTSEERKKTLKSVFSSSPFKPIGFFYTIIFKTKRKMFYVSTWKSKANSYIYPSLENINVACFLPP